jgi:flagellar basal-body rod protein FlgB
MLDQLFGGSAFVATTKALDAASLRHQVIANNLANVNTPGFKSRKVQFENALSKAIRQPGSGAIASVRPQVTTDSSTSERQDGNNVDMESEMVDLAANQIKFEALSQQVSNLFTQLKSVIKGT